MACCEHCGLLQRGERAAWQPGGVLHAKRVSRHGCWSQGARLRYGSAAVCSASSKSATTTQYEYLWADGVRVKKPVRLAAPDYINALFDWIEAQVS